MLREIDIHKTINQVNCLIRFHNENAKKQISYTMRQGLQNKTKKIEKQQQKQNNKKLN